LGDFLGCVVSTLSASGGGGGVSSSNSMGIAASSVAVASVASSLDISIASADSAAAAPEGVLVDALLPSSECTRVLLRSLVPGLLCLAAALERAVFMVDGRGRAFLPAPVASRLLALGERARGSRARSVEGEWREALEADGGRAAPAEGVRAGETGRRAATAASRAFDGVPDSRGLPIAPPPLPLLRLLPFGTPLPLPLLLLALGRLFVGDFPLDGRLRGLEMDLSTSLTPTGSSSLLARSNAARCGSELAFDGIIPGGARY